MMCQSPFRQAYNNIRSQLPGFSSHASLPGRPSLLEQDMMQRDDARVSMFGRESTIHPQTAVMATRYDVYTSKLNTAYPTDNVYSLLETSLTTACPRAQSRSPSCRALSFEEAPCRRQRTQWVLHCELPRPTEPINPSTSLWKAFYRPRVKARGPTTIASRS